MPDVFPLLLIAFIVVPIVELAVIIQVGGYIGVWETIALLILDSVIGAVLVKREGRRAWDAFRQALAETRWPGDEVTQGALILFGGALLLTPGFVTDLVGFLAVIPPTRALASRVLRRAVTPAPVREVFRIRDARSDRGRGRRTTDAPHGQSGGGEVLDVEVVRTERDEPPGRGDAADGARPPGELGAGGPAEGEDRPDGENRPDGEDRPDGEHDDGRERPPGGRAR